MKEEQKIDVSNICYIYTRIILSVVFVLNFIFKSEYNSVEKNIYYIVSFIVFLFFSYIYEKKRKIFSTTYVFYILFNTLSFNIFPYTYTTNKYMQETIIRFPKSRIPEDYYIMYAQIYIIISIIFLLVFNRTKKYQIEDFTESSIKSANKIFWSYLIILLPLYILKGSIFLLVFIPFTNYFIILFLTEKKARQKLNIKIGFVVSALIIILNLKTRYIVIQFILPIILALVIVLTLKKKKLKKSNSVGYFILFFSGISIFGVISELNKLSKLDQIFSLEIIKHYTSGQFYRLFGIWTILCGNVIDYVRENDYYKGLSYIKSLAGVLSFEYVNLSVLSAKLFSAATYAQIGLIGEGYANFGLIGGILSPLIVLIIIEVSFLNFMKKKNMVNLLFLTVPFTKVILDGGGINSIVFGALTILLTYIFRIRIFKKGEK